LQDRNGIVDSVYQMMGEEGSQGSSDPISRMTGWI
jgi:hypothetical protein